MGSRILATSPSSRCFCTVATFEFDSVPRGIKTIMGSQAILTRPQGNPLAKLSTLKWVVEARIEQMEKFLAVDRRIITASVTRERLQVLKGAWSRFEAQVHWVRIIAGRGRLQGLQSYHDTLWHHYGDTFVKSAVVLNELEEEEPLTARSSRRRLTSRRHVASK